MSMQSFLFTLLFPFLGGVLILLAPARSKWLHNLVLLITVLGNLFLVFPLFGQQAVFQSAWSGFDFGFAFRLYHFSTFSLAAVASFALVIGVYTVGFFRPLPSSRLFYSCFLFTIGLTNGAILADDLIVLLFFWEGLLITLFAMIYVGASLTGCEAWKTAVKAFVISGIADLCLLVGIGMTAYLAGTTRMSQVHLPLDGAGSVAFILMMVGAIAKAGSMPFHSWIPDASQDAPLPFMALSPASLEKLLGIYLLARLSLDLFVMQAHSWVSILLMGIGVLTIILAVLMALVQKDYKRLLSFHAISQVGYMLLGIGTAVPAGIVGGLFHMLNHAMYKSCLFLTGGAVEKQAGTTDLNKLGGLGRRMPLTFIGFCIAALSISGVPPFNGFFSKELVYDGALERGTIFYILALLGSVLTAASFLKLGHAAFLGKESSDLSSVKEAPALMTVPILMIAALCLLFGIFNPVPLREFIQPILGTRLEGQDFAGWPHSTMLVVLTIVALAAALINHLWGVKRSGSGLGAVDHIHHAPGLNDMYDLAEKRAFDPYEIALKGFRALAHASWSVDRGIDWIYNQAVPRVAFALSSVLRACHTGSHVTYVIWLLCGLLVMACSMVLG